MAEQGKPKSEGERKVNERKSNAKLTVTDLLQFLGKSPEELSSSLKRMEQSFERVAQLELDTQARVLKERKDALRSEQAEVYGKVGSTAMTKLSGLYKAAGNEDYFKTLNTGAKTAATVLKATMGSSATLANTFGMLTGAITPATAAFAVLEWAIGEAIDAFVEGFKTMREVQKTAAYQTNFGAQENSKFASGFIQAAENINSGITNLGRDAAWYESMFNIQRVTSSESLKTFQNVIREIKDNSLVSNRGFQQLAVGLEEMGYSFAGPIGQLMKSQYYRDSSKIDRTNEILNKLVGLSKSSSLSLDELVTIMGDTEEQNLNAWTLMRAGMGAEQATKLSTSYGTSKAAITAAADTLGLSKSGVDAIFTMINEIISSATDPTKLGDLTRKYQVGGMTGGRSISQVYRDLAGGDFTKVFKYAVDSATKTATNKSGLGFEYISSQFGSNIGTVLGAFTPTVISKLFSTIDAMSFGISETGLQDAELLGEINKSILNAPITMEDILNSLFDEFVKVGKTVADMFLFIQNPLGWLTGDKSAGGGKIDGSNGGSANDGFGGNGGSLWPAPGGAGSPPAYVPETGVPGVGGAFNIKDYYANDASGWRTNNDIKGVSPYRLSAGYMAPAYREKFGSDHKGVDYAAKEGTVLTSPVSGEVVTVGYSTTAGNYVTIQDESGRKHLLAHLQRATVRRGMRVRIGDTLGYVGKTGKATGPHVHYQVKDNGRAINPNRWAGTPFGGLPGNYAETSAMGRGDAGAVNSYDAVARPTTEGSYYNSTDIVNSINDLNLMLSGKLDIIITRMNTQKGQQTAFMYK